MPPKDKTVRAVIAENPWIDKFEDDQCLYETIIAALQAKGFAKKANASNSSLEPGDDALKQIRKGVVTGSAAWEKARVALRRFSEANGAASDWQGRRPGHSYAPNKLGRRYGKKRKRRAPARAR